MCISPFTLLLLISQTFPGNAQQELTLQPGPKEGKDVYIHEYRPSSNFGNSILFPASAWTYDGTPGILRGLIAFDLSGIPSDAIITTASLSLYHSIDRANPQHSTMNGPNTTLIQQVVSHWEENTVTWNNQPKVTTQNQVTLPVSSHADQDYVSVPVTKLVQGMVRNPKSNFGFMIRLQTESYYRSLMFSSSDQTNPELRPKLTITYSLPPVAPPVKVQVAKQINKTPKSSISDKPAKTVSVKTIHDTVYVDRLRTDTVYVERLRVDTIYVSPSPQDVDFTSLKNYAYTNLILLLDVSGSMKAPHKLPLLKQSVKRLLPLLRPEDKVSIIVYSGKAKVLLPATAGSETAKITKVIDGLKSDGSTDGNAGITLACKTASKNYIRGGNNRIILATDGGFVVNPEVLALVEQSSREEIYLSIFDFSGRNSQSQTSSPILQKLAEKGKGNCEMILPGNSDLKLLREAKAKPLN